MAATSEEPLGLSGERSMPYTAQMGVLHWVAELGDKATLDKLALTAQGMGEARTRIPRDMDLSGWSGERITKLTDSLDKLDAGNIARSRKFTDQIRNLTIIAPDQRHSFASFKPAGERDGDRRALVARLLTHITTGRDSLGENEEDVVQEAVQDIGYSFNKRYQVDGVFMVAALHFKSITNLTVELGATKRAGDGSCFSDLLFKLLKAESAAGKQSWPHLRVLDITTQGEESDILIPTSVETLVIRGLHDPLPRLGFGSTHKNNKLTSLTLTAGFAEGEVALMVKNLIESSNVPRLAHVDISNSQFNTAAVVSMFDAFRIFIPDRLQKVGIDVTYRADDPSNASGNNDHIESMQPLPLSIFYGLEALRVVNITRFLFPRQVAGRPVHLLDAITPYIEERFHHFKVTGAFAEEFTGMTQYAATVLQQPRATNVRVTLGVDFDLPRSAALEKYARPLVPVMKKIIKDRQDAKVSYRFLVRAIGSETMVSLHYQ